MADNAFTKLIQISIEKNLIKEEIDLTMTFVREKIFKRAFGAVSLFTDGYGKEEFTNSKIGLSKSRITYIYIHI